MGDGIGLALLGSTSIPTRVAATEMVFHVCWHAPAQGSIMRDVSRALLTNAAVTAEPPLAATEPIALPLTGFVRARLLLRLIPFSRATLWRRVKAGSFPVPVRLSEGITAWRAEDIRQWIQECR